MDFLNQKFLFDILGIDKETHSETHYMIEAINAVEAVRQASVVADDVKFTGRTCKINGDPSVS